MTDFNLDHITNFRFGQAFNELGWDNPVQRQPFVVEVGDGRFELRSVAHKRDVQVLQCSPGQDGRIPPYPIRQKIERRVTCEVREHLIVFVDAAKTTQVWQWVNREPGRPAQYRELVVAGGQAPELLRQKLSALRFTIDEEELLTVLGVTKRMDDSQPRDRVTKKFYKEFETQRKAFAEFIGGIPRVGKDMAEDQRWYTAVLIDRLMFLWFLQEKGFLDGSRHYLAERLASHQTSGHKKSFYRRFLCPLFFRGFAEERNDGNRAALQAEFGEVPYLNGGLFAQHQLEQKYGNALDVADAAFEKLFAFFAEWDWHLDDRPMAADSREINPDVLGYIFEKFVNQKQMGAYYTKEDITDYIGKNTIIPCLLGNVRAEHAAAFDALAWPLLEESGDAYIYAPMLKGVDLPYPARIEAGLDTEAPGLLQRRKPWNERAAEASSLPTEIWRETIGRHQHTRELRRRIAAGELREISDLVTCNLDIRQFAQDLIESCTDLALLRSFWFNLAGRLPRKANEKFRHGLSVLDPTCGSGAFLFAALNILKPLYDATLRTLHAVRSDALIAGEHTRPEKWQEIDEILARFAAASDERQQNYAVTKHIIVHNLYGVDIEEQATEIAKLRLFLRLVALLEPGDAIEPLPDIDFNIRHGNTLVGYASAEETERAVKGVGLPTSGNLFGEDPWQQIKLRLVAVEQAYNNFQIQQVQHHGQVSPTDKRALNDTLVELEGTLNRHLAFDCGVDPDKPKKYKEWEARHQPFHWYVDFYPLMASGGFDVLIGNPPYAEIPKDLDRSLLRRTFSSALEDWSRDEDLYTLIVERSLHLLGSTCSQFGMILPLSLAFSTKRSFVELRREVFSHHRHWLLSHFDRIPDALFGNDVRTRCTIAIYSALPSSEKWKVATTSLLRWQTEARQQLFHTISYSFIDGNFQFGIPKVSSQIQADVLREIAQLGAPLATELIKSIPFEQLARVAPNFPQPCVYIGGTAYNWFPVWRDIPVTTAVDGSASLPARTSGYRFDNEDDANIVFALLCSSLGYWWWAVASDGFNLKKWLLERFPVSVRLVPEAFRSDLAKLGEVLHIELRKNYVYKDNKGRIGNYFLPACAAEVLAIDDLLADAIPGLSREFFDSVREFNACFSRA